MDIEIAKHKDLIRQSYALRAGTYEEHVRPGENIAPMIDLAMPKETDRLLDAACGAGLVALGFAPLVREAVGVDLTPEMIELARRRAAKQGAANVRFELGDAEEMAFQAETFDIVACRSAFHHMADSGKALREMARVLRPKGRMVIYDLVTSAHTAKAALHNEIMRMRDPSHVRILSPQEWTDFARSCGLKVAAKIVVMMKREFDDWMDMAAADPVRRVQVREALLATVKGDKAGLGVRARGEKITFSQTAGIWLLTK